MLIWSYVIKLFKMYCRCWVQYRLNKECPNVLSILFSYVQDVHVISHFLLLLQLDHVFTVTVGESFYCNLQPSIDFDGKYVNYFNNIIYWCTNNNRQCLFLIFMQLVIYFDDRFEKPVVTSLTLTLLNDIPLLVFVL